MADLRISQLTEVTAPIVTDVLPIVNANETKRISVNSLNQALPTTTFVQSNSANWGGILSFARFDYAGPFSGGPLYTGDNLINNTDNYIPWDSTGINTDSNTFELVNPDSANARIWIKRTGFYQISTRMIYFDCYNNSITVHLDSNTASTGGGWGRLATISRDWWPTVTPNPPAITMVGSVVVGIASVPRYISVAINPTANTPFPSLISGSSSSIFLTRIGSI
jgi:hypothetical protein